MKKYYLLLMCIFVIGCGYERVYVGTGNPFVIGTITQLSDGNILFIADRARPEMNFGCRARIILTHDYGYKVGDTLRIVDMNKHKDEGEK